MIFSKSDVEYNPIMAGVSRFGAILSPFKFARWIAGCSDQQPTHGPKERVVQYVQNLTQAITGNYKCEAQPYPSFMGRLGTITKRCSIVFIGVLGFTGAVYGISVGLEKTGEWLKIPYKCMIPQTGACFGDPIEVVVNGVKKMESEEITCPLVEGLCTDGEGVKKTLADWSANVGEWMVTSAKERQNESLRFASYLLLPIYGVTVAAPNWIATKATEWKTERLKTEDLVSDGIRLGATLFAKVEASWTSVTDRLAKQFSTEG